MRVAKKNPVLAKHEMYMLRHTAFLVKKIIVTSLREDFQDERWMKLRLKPKDQRRLINFQVWSVRHQIPVRYIVKVLLGYWREKTKRPKKKQETSILGASIAALTSSFSERLLCEQIKKDFPGQEHIAQRKIQAQMRLLGLLDLHGRAKGLISSDSIEQSCKIYISRVQDRRALLDEAASSAARKRRRWRGNPWL